MEVIGTRTCTTTRKLLALLDERGVDYEFRDYVKQPLSREEVAALLDKLDDTEPGSLLRKRDKHYKALGLTGKEGRERVVELVAEHPTLLQRPIAVHGERAVVARPPERALELVE